MGRSSNSQVWKLMIFDTKAAFFGGSGIQMTCLAFTELTEAFWFDLYILEASRLPDFL